MRRLIGIAAPVLVCSWLVVQQPRMQTFAQEGAMFKDPFASDLKETPKAGSYIQGVLPTSGSTTKSTALPQRPATLTPPKEQPDINKDIAVKPELGPWMIFINSYAGEDAPKMARQMAMELRNTYKLPSYVFNRGAEKRQEEYERVKGILEKQRQFFMEHGLTPEEALRLRTVHIEDQCAVLIGGYGSDKAARDQLDKIRKLPAPDPKRVQLDTKFQYDDQKKEGESVYINPFTTAFVSRNPALKNDPAASEQDKLDIGVLKHLNADEDYSLLKCAKPWTLVVRQFALPSKLQSDKGGGFSLPTVFKSKGAEQADIAKTNSRALCKLFRDAHLDAYVLHTTYYTLLTIGGFDSLEDPNLRATQTRLESLLPTVQAQLAAQMNSPPGTNDFFPQPMPMRVPR